MEQWEDRQSEIKGQMTGQWNCCGFLDYFITDQVFPFKGKVLGGCLGLQARDEVCRHGDEGWQLANGFTPQSTKWWAVLNCCLVSYTKLYIFQNASQWAFVQKNADNMTGEYQVAE